MKRSERDVVTRMVLGALLLGAIGIAFQAALGLMFATQSMWDPNLVLLMVLVGFLGGYSDHRRELKRRRAAAAAAATDTSA